MVKASESIRGSGVWKKLLENSSWLVHQIKWIKKRVSWSTSAEARGVRAIKILAKQDQIRRITSCHYVVKSQTDDSVEYNVIRNGHSWSCDCPDYKFRKAQCKHMLSVLATVVHNEKRAVGIIDEPTSGTLPNEVPEQEASAKVGQPESGDDTSHRDSRSGERKAKILSQMQAHRHSKG